jgi:starch-binding outer membrane protein, SusD/RagB family
MKKYKFLYLIIFLASFGCADDMLDRKPLDILTEDLVWNDQALVDAKLYGVYQSIPFLYNDVANWSGRAQNVYQQYHEHFLGCEGYNISWQGQGFELGRLQSDGGCLEWWERGYAAVRGINDFMDRVSASTALDEDFKKQRIAEARFLRAFAYFTMVKRYGGVPLITKTTQLDDSEEELYPKRDKEEDIYNFILSECDAIAADLPETYGSNDYGRPTKYAVLALKSRAAMYAASIAQWGTVQLEGVVGIPSDKAQSLWQASYNASKAIMDAGKFQLYNKYPDDKAKNYQMIWLDERNVETIFAKQYTGEGGIGNNWEFMQIPKLYHQWGDGNATVPYLETIDEYENIDGTSGILDREEIQTKLYTMEELWGKKDPRFHGSIYTQGTMWFGNPLQFYRGILDENGILQTSGSVGGKPVNGSANPGPGRPWGLLKFLDPTVKVRWPNKGATDWIVFRYGEILLNFAEAAFELNKPDEALDAINQIRTRAGIPVLSEITRDAIRHERKVELKFELHRYWDLRRYRTAVTELTGHFSSFNLNLDITTGKFRVELIERIRGNTPPTFYEQNYYFPITPTRISNNPNLVENPGY